MTNTSAGQGAGPDRSSGAVFAARAVLAVAAAVYAAATWAFKGDPPSWIDPGLYLSVLAGAVLVVAARPLLVERDRGAWTWLVFALASWVAGDTIWTLTYADLPDPPFPSVADGLYLGLYPLAYIGIVLLVRAQVSRLPVEVWLDGVVSACGAAAVFSAVFLGPILSATEGDTLSVLTNLAYPIGDLALVGLVVGSLAVIRWRFEPSWWLLGAGFCAFAVADTAFLFQTANDTYSAGTWVDALWVLGVVLLPMAAWKRLRTDDVTQLQGLTALLVPILISLAGLVVVVVATTVKVNGVAVALATTGLVAAGVRTALTFRQTRALAQTQLLAMTDELTGLGNRRMLDERLRPAILARREPARVAVVVLDLTHVEEVNDTLGYDAGDALLHLAGRRLLAALPRGATGSRLGGAGLAAILPEQYGAQAAIDSARRLVEVFDDPFPVADAALHVEARAGVALAPDHGESAAELLAAAHVALLRATNEHVPVSLYDPNVDSGRERAQGLAVDLRGAISREELDLLHQPVLDLATGRVDQVETLLYWRHRRHGMLPAEAFLPLAERSGLSRQVTRWLLHRVVRQYRGWYDSGRPVAVSVNLTLSDLLDGRLPYDIARTLNEGPMAPETLVLEMAEEVLAADAAQARRAIDQLRSLGVRTALDHYGRGASSLTRLRSLGVDEVKLDASFVRSAVSGPEDAAVVRATLDLCRSLGIRTVATGVDDARLFETLRAFGCDAAQGEHIAPAGSAQDVTAFLDHYGRVASPSTAGH